MEHNPAHNPTPTREPKTSPLFRHSKGVLIAVAALLLVGGVYVYRQSNSYEADDVTDSGFPSSMQNVNR